MRKEEAPVKLLDMVKIVSNQYDCPSGTEGALVEMFDEAGMVEINIDDTEKDLLDSLITVRYEDLELVWSAGQTSD